jgi:hypothetical protein
MTTATNETPTSNATPQSSSPNHLHDLFSTAQLTSALAQNPPHDNSYGIRLPHLLRYLAALQNNNSHPLEDHNEIEHRLEDIASSHSGAETIEMLLACSPNLCGVLNGMDAPSRQRHAFYGSSVWDTSGLSGALHRLSTGVSEGNKRGNDAYNDVEKLSDKRRKLENDSSDDEHDNEGTLDETSTLANGAYIASLAASDSYESIMKRTLQELLSLVRSSLDNEAGCYYEKEKPSINDASSHRELISAGLSIKSDSLFAERKSSSSSLGGGCSSLSVMVVTLMHHAPLLRHDHVAVS